MARTKKEKDYSKEQILKAEKFECNKDIAAAVLEEGARYTLKNAEKLISAFMKGKVN